MNCDTVGPNRARLASSHNTQETPFLLPQVRKGPRHGPVHWPAIEKQPADRQPRGQEARVHLAAGSAGGAGGAAPEPERGRDAGGAAAVGRHAAVATGETDHAISVCRLPSGQKFVFSTAQLSIGRALVAAGEAMPVKLTGS